MLLPLTEQDSDTLRAFWASEGSSGAGAWEKEGSETYLWRKNGDVIGFFTCEMRHGYPHLAHFYIAKQYRNGRHALILMRAFRDLMKINGHKKYIIHAPKNRREVAVVIAWYANCEPYDETAQHRFYLMEA